MYNNNNIQSDKPLYIIETTDTYKLNIMYCGIGSILYKENEENLKIDIFLGNIKCI